MKISFVLGLKMLYELKRNESLSKDNLRALNNQLEDQGILEFLQGFNLMSFTLKARKKNKTHFIISMEIGDGSVKDIFFGEHPKAGTNLRNPYLSADIQFIEEVSDKWEERTKAGKQELGLGLVFSTAFSALKAIFQGKLRVKPFWSILGLRKFLRFSLALKNAELNASIVLG